jgi:hypothetical protein
MNETNHKLILSEFGYTFLPKQRKHSPGYPGVEIIIKAENIQKPRDIRKVEIITSSTNGIEKITIFHPTTVHGQYHVVPGRIVIKNHKGDESELFTLGGSLRIVSDELETKCSVISSAPILDLDTDHDTYSNPKILAEEIEDLFALLKARLVLHNHTFLEQLTKTDPMLLYEICLDSINQHINESNLEELSQYVIFHQFLNEEISDLKKENIWTSGIIRTFEDIL